MHVFRSLFLIGLACAAASATACGSTRVLDPDAQPIDAPPGDAPEVSIDAGVDAATDASVDAPPPPPGQELTSASGRLTGPTFALDVQLGHPIGQQPIQGPTFRITANTPIKP